MQPERHLDARNDALDAWRAILIAAVAAYHYLYRWAPPRADFDLYHYDQTYPQWFDAGRYGVDLFFVISGFVIAMTLARSDGVIDFLFRRASRLLPGYWMAALVTFLVVSWFGPPQLQVDVTGFLTTLIRPIIDFGGKQVDGAYWSIDVEIKFYAFVALSSFLLRRRFWIGLTAVGAIGLAVELFAPKAAKVFLLAPFMPFFLVGVATWLALNGGRAREVAIVVAVAGAGFALHIGQFTIGHVFSPLLVASLTLLMALLIATMVSPPNWPLGPLPYLGRVSYAAYLLHQNIGVTIIGIAKQSLAVPDMVALAIAATAALALSLGLFHLIEVPAQRWLRAWYSKRAPRPDVALA